MYPSISICKKFAITNLNMNVLKNVKEMAKENSDVPDIVNSNISNSIESLESYGKNARNGIQIDPFVLRKQTGNIATILRVFLIMIEIDGGTVIQTARGNPLSP